MTDRNSKWQRDGIKVHPLPKRMALITMRGGQMLTPPKPGDDIELYVNTDKGKGGMWVPGYVAMSGVESGQMGGAYDGQDVAWVNKSGSFDPEDDGPIKGAEWPVQMLRLAKGDKAPFAPKEAPQPSGTATMSMYDAMFAFNPSELRDYHGRWLAGSGGNYAAVNPAGQVVQDPVEKVTERGRLVATQQLALMGLTPQDVVKRVEAIYDFTTPEQQKALSEGATWPTEAYRAIGAAWYNEVHDMAWQWAQQFDVKPEIVSAVIASLSPQVAWGEGPDGAGDPGSSMAQFMISNQGNAYKVFHVAYEMGNDTVNITPEVVAKAHERHCNAKGVLSMRGMVNYEAYQGMDGLSPMWGKSLMGKHKVSELPGDALWELFPQELKGTMQPRANAAIMLARGIHPDTVINQKTGARLLNGPKIRSFYNNIVAPQSSEEATIDVHMIAAMTELGILNREAQLLVGGGGNYQLMSDLIKEAAHARGVKPHAMQAAVWLQWRRMHQPEEKQRAKAARAKLLGVKPDGGSEDE